MSLKIPAQALLLWPLLFPELSQGTSAQLPPACGLDVLHCLSFPVQTSYSLYNSSTILPSITEKKTWIKKHFKKCSPSNTYSSFWPFLFWTHFSGFSQKGWTATAQQHSCLFPCKLLCPNGIFSPTTNTFHRCCHQVSVATPCSKLPSADTVKWP